jgi:hypothetical protein
MDLSELAREVEAREKALGGSAAVRAIEEAERLNNALGGSPAIRAIEETEARAGALSAATRAADELRKQEGALGGAARRTIEEATRTSKLLDDSLGGAAVRKMAEENARIHKMMDAGLGGAVAKAAAEASRAVRGFDPFAGVRTKYSADVFSANESIQRSIAEAREAPTAKRAVSRISAEIRAFEDSLDPESEVGVKLVSFGGSVVVHIREVGYWQPNLILFAGQLEDESPVRLIQHISQLSFLLMRVPRIDPEEPRCPIGFPDEGVELPDQADCE